MFLLLERTKATLVLLDKNEYLNKMEQMLADKDIYEVRFRKSLPKN